MRLRNACLGLAAALSVLTQSSLTVSAQERWATYTNARFGTTADYPADLFTVLDPAPDNADGQSFWTPDRRANLLIYGANNAEADTPQSYLLKYGDAQDATFTRVTDAFYAVSGNRDGVIYYRRCNFPPVRDTIDCFTMTYPAGEKAAWDPIVTRVSHSLRQASIDTGDNTGDDVGSDQVDENLDLGDEDVSEEELGE